jgi:hypothetical protein
MTVVQKQLKTISADELFTDDADTPPAEIVYDVINMPTNGRLVAAENIRFFLQILLMYIFTIVIYEVIAAWTNPTQLISLRT